MTAIGHPRRRTALGGLLMAASQFVTGCAFNPTVPGDSAGPAPAEVPLAGRLSVQVEGQPERSLAADFELHGSSTRGELVLGGPLGTTAARARWAPGEAVLRTPQGETLEPDLDALARHALGEAVPMAALFHWLRGRPWPQAPSQALEDGRSGFEQLGWQVLLDRLADGRIEARRLTPPSVTVRVKLAPG